MKVYVVALSIVILDGCDLPDIRGIYTSKKKLAKAIVANKNEFNFPAHFTPTYSNLMQILKRDDGIEIINEYSETITIEFIETDAAFRTEYK